MGDINYNSLSKVNFYPLERLEQADLFESINTFLWNLASLVGALIPSQGWLGDIPQISVSSSTYLTITINSPIIARTSNDAILITRALDINADGNVQSFSLQIDFSGYASGTYLVYFTPAVSITSDTRYFLDLQNQVIYTATKDIKQYEKINIVAELYTGATNYASILNYLSSNNKNAVLLCTVDWDGLKLSNLNRFYNTQNQVLSLDWLLRSMNFTNGVLYGCQATLGSNSISFSDGYAYINGRVIKVPAKGFAFLASGDYLFKITKDGNIIQTILPDDWATGTTDLSDSIPLYRVNSNGIVITASADLSYKAFPKNYAFSQIAGPIEYGWRTASNSTMKHFYLAFNCQNPTISGADLPTSVSVSRAYRNAFCIIFTPNYGLSLWGFNTAGATEFLGTIFLQNIFKLYRDTDNNFHFVFNQVMLDAIPNSISGSAIKDGTITESKLANNSVSTRTIQTNAVTESKLADGAVTGAKIANHVVSTLKIYRHPFVVATPDGDTVGDISGWSGLKSLIESGNFNGTIFLKTGYYYVTSTINVPDATDYLHIVGDVNVRLKGNVQAFNITTDGWKSIIFENVIFEVTGNTTTLINIRVPTNYGYYVRFSNCAFWGTSSNYQAQVILMNGNSTDNSKLYLDQCEFSHFTKPSTTDSEMIRVLNTQVFMTNCDFWTIPNNTLIYVSGCETYITSCQQRTDTSRSVIVVNGGFFKMVNSRFMGSESSGLMQFYNGNIALIGNYLRYKDGTNDIGLFIKATSYQYLWIIGNYILASGDCSVLHFDVVSGGKVNAIVNANQLWSGAGKNVFYEDVKSGGLLSGIATNNIYWGNFNVSANWTSDNNRGAVG